MTTIVQLPGFIHITKGKKITSVHMSRSALARSGRFKIKEKEKLNTESTIKVELMSNKDFG